MSAWWKRQKDVPHSVVTNKEGETLFEGTPDEAWAWMRAYLLTRPWKILTNTTTLTLQENRKGG